MSKLKNLENEMLDLKMEISRNSEDNELSDYNNILKEKMNGIDEKIHQLKGLKYVPPTQNNVVDEDAYSDNEDDNLENDLKALEEKERIKTLNNEITELEKKQSEAIKRKSKPTILEKLSKFILKKKMELSKLEVKPENKAIIKLREEITNLHEERKVLDELIFTKESQLNSLLPKYDQKQTLDNADDDQTKILKLMKSKRDQYFHLYGKQPHEGTNLAVVGKAGSLGAKNKDYF